MGICSGSQRVVLTNLCLLFVALGVILMVQGHIFIISWHLTSITSISLPNHLSTLSSINMFQVMQCWFFLGILGFLYTFSDVSPYAKVIWKDEFLGHF